MSRNFEEDFLFFYNNRKKFNFTDRYFVTVCYNSTSPPAKSLFIKYLQGGKRPTLSSEPDLLQELLTCEQTIKDFIRKSAFKHRENPQPVAIFLSNFENPPRWVLSKFIKFAGLTDN